MLSGYELDEAFQRKTVPEGTEFADFWPTETMGKGVVEKNNSRSGGAQGRGSLIQKAKCRLCGFPNDMTKADHSGGSLDGNGAGGGIVNATARATFPNGTVYTEAYGTQAFRNNSGCALCFSKNSSGQRTLLTGGNPWDKVQPFGF